MEPQLNIESIPETLRQCLDLQHVSYGIQENVPLTTLQTISDDQSKPCLIRSAVLIDSLGMLQVLFPANCMVDLTHLCETLGRNLQCIDKQALERLRAKLKLDFIPAVPQLTELTTIADQRLLKMPNALLETGIPETYIALDNDQLRRMLAEIETCDICQRLKPNTDQTPDEQGARSIHSAVEKFTTLRIKQRLEETLEIPPLPSTAEDIIKLRVDPNAGIGELAQVVEKDPSLSAQVVSWAGSPYYAAPGKVTSVHDAVVRVLGFDLVINLALGLSLGRTLEIPKNGPRNETPYWQQAVYCAAAMESLVRHIDPDCAIKPSMGFAYLSGLLHNFGYLLLSFTFPPYFSLISRYIEVNPHVHHEQIEHHLLGVTREHMAGWLMSLWNMPEEVATALRWQHEPHYSGDHCEYANLLYLALNLLREQGIGSEFAHPMDDRICARLGLTLDEARKAIALVIEKSDDIETMASELS